MPSPIDHRIDVNQLKMTIVKRCLSDSVLTADIVDLATGFGLGDNRQYLGFGEIRFFHGSSK